MLPNTDPTNTLAWKELEVHAREMASRHMKDLFAQNPDRFANLSQTYEDILVDYSKNIITQETLDLLYRLAEECWRQGSNGKNVYRGNYQWHRGPSGAPHRAAKPE
jgi:allophanate hydrolase subunit 1